MIRNGLLNFRPKNRLSCGFGFVLLLFCFFSLWRSPTFLISRELIGGKVFWNKPVKNFLVSPRLFFGAIAWIMADYSSPIGKRWKFISWTCILFYCQAELLLISYQAYLRQNIRTFTFPTQSTCKFRKAMDTDFSFFSTLFWLHLISSCWFQAKKHSQRV